MLKGTRSGILRRIEQISIHGQVSYDVIFVDPAGPDDQLHIARLGAEAIEGAIEPGDRIQIDYLVGVPVKVTRISPA